MEDRDILDCIQGLVAEQRRLRDLRDGPEAGENFAYEGLAEIESELAHLWALLRHRRALRSAGVHPEVMDLRTAELPA